MEMKWHKFLCCFGLWACAAVNALPGVRVWKLGEVSVAVLSLAVAIFWAYVAMQLIKKKWIGVTLLRIALGINIVLIAPMRSVLLQPTVENTVFFAVSLVLLAVNWVYYLKRRDMFA